MNPSRRLSKIKLEAVKRAEQSLYIDQPTPLQPLEKSPGWLFQVDDGCAPTDEQHDWTIGELLRCARSHQGMGLSEAAARTKIKPMYLRAMERDQFSTLPAGPFARGFLRSYARVLALNPKELVRMYEQNKTTNRPRLSMKSCLLPKPWWQDPYVARSFVAVMLLLVFVLAVYFWQGEPLWVLPEPVLPDFPIPQHEPVTDSNSAIKEIIEVDSVHGGRVQVFLGEDGQINYRSTDGVADHLSLGPAS